MTSDWQMALTHYNQLRANYWTQMWLLEERKKQQTDEIPIFFAGLSFAVDKLDNIITLAIA